MIIKYIEENKLFIVAIALSAIAEYFSIFGSSKLFGGHAISVIVMGIALAVAKLIIAMLLKTEWEQLHKYLRNYLIGALIVLSVWTSVGIYGFLSDGYAATKSKDNYITTQTNLVKKRKEYYEGNVADCKQNLVSVTKSIEGLRTNLSTDNQTQQVVKGQLITNIVTSSKKGVQEQLNKALLEKNKLDSLVLCYNDSISVLELKIINIEQSSDVASELGSLKYISTVTGVGMDSVVNYLLLMIIFIFDPLALALLWAYYSTQTKKHPDPEPEVQQPIVPEPPVEVPEVKPQPTRNVTKRLGRPPKKQATPVEDLIDSIIDNKPIKQRKPRQSKVVEPDIEIPVVKKKV